MRELKFRAWDKLDNRMIVDEQGFIPLKVTNKGVLKLSPKHVDELWTIVNGDRFEMMQYTGLKDKNGKEIYEGDIVNVNHYGGTPKYETVRFYTIAGCAGIHPFTDSGHHWASHRCEIVGNIYENPELLEEQHG